MYNRVIIAEKPDMGENIAMALGVKSKERGYIVLQNGDVVTWGIGHLIRLKTPDAYEKYKEWTWEALPVIPEQMLTEVDPKKLDQFKTVKRLLDQSRECILATDPDREGEYIGRLILNQCGYRKKWKRLWIHDLTEPTIRNGMANLRDGDEFTLLGDAAETRSHADYWLGFTASRFFSLLGREVTGGQANLSAGRVQTPTLRLVYDREMQMENFEPTPFFQLIASIQTAKGIYKGLWFRVDSEGKINRFETQAEADEMKKKIFGQNGSVEGYNIKEVKRHAPQLLNSSALKTEARKQLGFSTVKTTNALQALYDKGYVSYPRSDSRHLSQNKADELAQHLQALREKSEYVQLFPETLQPLKAKRFVDDKKAAVHHAIVPTDKNPALYGKDSKDHLSADEAKLYELILRHTLAAHHPEGTDRETEVITKIVDELFYSRSTEVISKGWRSLLKADSEEDENEGTDQGDVLGRIPELEQGLSVTAAGAELTKGKTSKPKRLNDDELEKLMENAGRFVDENLEEEVLEAIKERGIGTPATRTNIVQKLVAQEYIQIDKNLVYLTPKGRAFMEMVYESPIASIELTGEFEKKLGEVEKGMKTADSLLEEFKKFTYEILESKESLRKRIQGLSQNIHAFQNVQEVGSCPKCGGTVIEHKKVYSCTNKGDECDFVLWKDFRGVTIKPKQAGQLLEGKELLLKNVPAKEDKPSYDVFLKLVDGKIDTRFPTAEDKSLGKCPSCGKPVVEGQKGYGCSGWREGCKFVIWKSFRHIEIPPNIAKSLLAGKEVLLKDIPGKEKTYDLVLKIKNGQLDTRFPSAADVSLGSCPRCKKPVVEFEKSFGCSAWKEGCTFRLPKVFLSMDIPAPQIKKLLKSGKTDLLKGFVGKKGSFDSALGYDQEANRYSFLKK